ncbi:hypothetical protein AWC38_SpisGene21975 [Stylophora pistillata]|uniref:Uncharacterized protein n=1 Tax=Stylophora pistillata TaxID=50429 RepID=A0A2B4RBN3_STYPI|nr:hypothetical protein AWC38_SpisGene21975 [Stylophora pistillata]
MRQSHTCWTEEHDKVLVREIIANKPFDGTTKKSTPARGAKWNAVINQLLQIRELEKGLEVTVEWEDATDLEQKQTAAQKKKTKEEERNAEEVRKRAMEGLGANKRRGEDRPENNEGLKRRWSSEADTLEYLKERNERMDAIKREEMELRREELRLQEARQEAAIQQQQLQLAAQQRQLQQFQTMMLSVI